MLSIINRKLKQSFLSQGINNLRINFWKFLANSPQIPKRFCQLYSEFTVEFLGRQHSWNLQFFAEYQKYLQQIPIKLVCSAPSQCHNVTFLSTRTLSYRLNYACLIWLMWCKFIHKFYSHRIFFVCRWLFHISMNLYKVPPRNAKLENWKQKKKRLKKVSKKSK